MSLPWDTINATVKNARLLKLSGKVVRSDGLIVDGTMPGAQLGMMCRLMIRGLPEGVPAEIVAVRDRYVSLMPLTAVPGISAGTRIEPMVLDLSVPVGDALIGRVIDGLGQPLDGGVPLEPTFRVPLHPPPLNPLERAAVNQVLPLGIGAIDGLMTCAEGQRLAILAGAGVGKSTLLGMMARHAKVDVIVVGLIGERSREVKEFIENDLGPEGVKRSVTVVATSNTSVALRLRAAFMATAICEFFRDEGRRVLLVMDSLSRVCAAQRELGLATGEVPGARGYPPSAFAIVPRLLERAGPGTRGGSITAFYTALAEQGDQDTSHDPILNQIKSVTDGHIVLSSELAERGHYPAIDVAQSISRVMGKVRTPEYRRAVNSLKEMAVKMNDAEELSQVSAALGGADAAARAQDPVLAFRDDYRDFLQQTPEEVRDFAETSAQVERLAARFETLKASEREAARAGEGR